MTEVTQNGDISQDGIFSDPETVDSKHPYGTRKTDTSRSLAFSTLSGGDRLPMPNGPLHHLSDLLGRNMKLDGISEFKGSLPSIPINDLRGEEASIYTREECVLRRSLAALYRLVDVRGWSQSIYNHISARCPGDKSHFIINPFGLLYHEMQASSFIKIDEEGKVIQQGSTVLSVNTAGWTLHSALHSARQDVNCIVHVHLPDVIAVSCIKAGLLPVSPEAIELILQRGVRYHDYQGILINKAERASIQSDLGPKAKILFLRNHGVAIAASSVAEAWYLVKRVVAACQTQMLMLQLGGGASLLAELKETGKQLEQEAELNMQISQSVPDLNRQGQENGNGCDLVNGKACSDAGDIPWTPEDLEFEAEMRVLDSAGYRTGHVYRQPNLLRKAHSNAAWSPDGGYGDQMTGAELATTDFSATEFSGTDDVALAEKAGAEQRAKIASSIQANRQKSMQRNQYLSHDQDNAAIVTSSMLASPDVKSTPYPRHDNGYHHTPPYPMDEPLISSMATPVRRPDIPSDMSRTASTRNGDGRLDASHTADRNGKLNKSATLPPPNKQQRFGGPRTKDTLDRSVLSTDEEEAKPGKVKKRGSFRMPSFARKKKH